MFILNSQPFRRNTFLQHCHGRYTQNLAADIYCIIFMSMYMYKQYVCIYIPTVYIYIYIYTYIIYSTVRMHYFY